MSDDLDAGIPQDDPDARVEWIIKRAQKLDFIREEDWIADEIEYLWNHPDEFEAGETFNAPEGVDDADYALFHLALCFGTDYEHYFPRGEWRDGE